LKIIDKKNKKTKKDEIKDSTGEHENGQESYENMEEDA
jgi:hypothetical protein